MKIDVEPIRYMTLKEIDESAKEDYKLSVPQAKLAFLNMVGDKPVFHKGRHCRTYDYYTCGKCGHTVEINDNYCRFCGRSIIWDSTRCLTGK